MNPRVRLTCPILVQPRPDRKRCPRPAPDRLRSASTGNAYRVIRRVTREKSDPPEDSTILVQLHGQQTAPKLVQAWERRLGKKAGLALLEGGKPNPPIVYSACASQTSEHDITWMPWLPS